MRDIEAVAKGCTHFLCGHKPKSVRQRMLDIAASPLALLRNDGYGRGGAVAEVEREVAALLGKEAAVFMPSGTMAQQIALRTWSDRAGNRHVAFHPTCHLQIHEQMAYRELHGLEATLLGDADRLFTLADLEAVERPVSSLLIELPQREIGGQLPSRDELIAICDAAQSRGARVHMDGARLWECAPFYGRPYAEICAPFDSVYVSCYKILGGLPGAILAGPPDFIDEARIWLRRHGGNLQQQSPNAIAAKLGLDEQLPRIPSYVAKAQEIAAVLRAFDQVRLAPEYPPTNMTHVFFMGDRDRLVDAALQIAEEDKVALFFGLRPGDDGRSMLEMYIADGADGLEADEVRRLFAKLFSLAE